MDGDVCDETHCLHCILCFSYLILHQGSHIFATDPCVSTLQLFYPQLGVACFVVAVRDCLVCMLVVVRLPVPRIIWRPYKSARTATLGSLENFRPPDAYKTPLVARPNCKTEVRRQLSGSVPSEEGKILSRPKISRFQVVGAFPSQGSTRPQRSCAAVLFDSHQKVLAGNMARKELCLQGRSNLRAVLIAECLRRKPSKLQLRHIVSETRHPGSLETAATKGVPSP